MISTCFESSVSILMCVMYVENCFSFSGTLSGVMFVFIEEGALYNRMNREQNHEIHELFFYYHHIVACPRPTQEGYATFLSNIWCMHPYCLK